MPKLSHEIYYFRALITHHFYFSKILNIIIKLNNKLKLKKESGKKIRNPYSQIKERKIIN